MKKKQNIIISIILIIVVVLISFNLVTSKILTNIISDVLAKNKNKYYSNTIENIDFNIWKKTISIENPNFSPSKEKLTQLSKANTKKNHTEEISLKSIELIGIDFWALISNREINIETLKFNNLSIYQYKNSKIQEKVKNEEIEKIDINIDSLKIEVIEGIDINTIEFSNLNFHIYDYSVNKTVFETNSINFKSSGFKLKKVDHQTFKLLASQDELNINNIKLNLKDTHFLFDIGNINLNFKTQSLNISDIKFKPTIAKEKIAALKPFNDDVFDLEVENIHCDSINIKKLIEFKGLYISKVQIDKLSLSLFKDQNKPFNTNKRPGLPHTGLKSLDFPILVNEVEVKDSKVQLEQLLPEKELRMFVPITRLNVSIKNITSIKENRENPLIVSGNGTLFNEGHASIYAVFNLDDTNNDFYMKGNLNKTKMKIFDRALFPILGLKILDGEVDHVQFYANANTKEAKGKMIFEYHDLKAEVFKSDDTQKTNKFLSWAVNTVIQNSNPKKGKTTPKEVDLFFERVEHKGLGNYFWKTLQGGIIKTIAPGGKSHE